MWALVAEGATLEEIAAKVKMARANVKCHLGYRGGQWFPRKPGRYWIDAAGGLHPCRSVDLELVALVTVRPPREIEQPAIDDAGEIQAPDLEPDGEPFDEGGEALEIPEGKIDLGLAPSGMEAAAALYGKAPPIGPRPALLDQAPEAGKVWCKCGGSGNAGGMVPAWFGGGCIESGCPLKARTRELARC